MYVGSAETIVDTIRELYPVTLTEAQKPAWVQQFRAVLSGLTSDEINAAWHRCMETWRKKSGPQPADILAAHRAPKGTSGHGASAELTRSHLVARLAKRDDEMRERRNALESEFIANHPSVVAMAQAEGWEWHLRQQLRLGAGILAQRQLKAETEARFGALSTEDQEYFGIYEIDGAERLVVTNAMIDRWRSYAGPAPTLPARSSAFEQAGRAA